MSVADIKLLPRADLDRLLTHLQKQGYALIGPRKRDHAIVYESLDSAAELPVGYTDEQEGGHYRLKASGDESVFSYVVGPDSWKKHLFVQGEVLFQAHRDEDGNLKISDEFGMPCGANAKFI